MFKNLLIALTITVNIINVASAAAKVDSTIAQYDGYIVNNQNAQQAIEILWEKSLDAEAQEKERRIASYNSALEESKALNYQEREYRNIIAQLSNGHGSSNPHDFVSRGSYVVHWLSVGDSTLTCQHSSASGVQAHADIFIKSIKAASISSSNRWYMDNLLVDPGSFAQSYYNKRLANVLLPFAELKRADLLLEIQKMEANIKEINCQVVVGKIDNPLYNVIPFVNKTKDLTCKTTKKCKLIVVENKHNILEIGCACGHDLSEHKLVYKAKEQKTTENVSPNYDDIIR